MTTEKKNVKYIWESYLRGVRSDLIRFSLKLHYKVLMVIKFFDSFLGDN